MNKMYKRLIILSIIILVFIGTCIFFVWNIFFGQSAANQAEYETAMNENVVFYDTYTPLPQDPVMLDGTVSLVTDDSYYYNKEMGTIESIHVKDGQKVKKGQLLYTYYSGGDVEDQIEDALREQTRLYDQRVQLIDQLSKLTGLLYNYQGDLIQGYWAEDDNQYYYVAESIGKGGQPTVGEAVSEDVMQANDNDDTEAIGSDSGDTNFKDQIRQLNQQIEDVEVKLIRLREKERGEVTANFNGQVILDESGKDSNHVPLVRIISEDVQVRGSVTEYEFYTLAKDRPVTLLVNAEGREVSGTIVDYDEVPPASAPASNPQGEDSTPSGNDSSTSTRYGFTISVDEFIQPGFSVKIQLTIPGLAIPAETIIEEDGRHYVFVFEDGMARKREVSIENLGLLRVVNRGIEEGEQILMNPYGVVDGQEVQVMESSMLDPMMPEGSEGDIEGVMMEDGAL